jgi:hypothetical protein
VLPFLRIVTESGLRVPRTDLAPLIRKLCETHWKQAGGSGGRLNLRLQPLILDYDRVGWLAEAVQALLDGGLSPGFSPRYGAVGVHLWSLDGPEQGGILLVADDGAKLLPEPSTPLITRARHLTDKADCRLIWQPARGAVWRIHIPATRTNRGRCPGWNDRDEPIPLPAERQQQEQNDRDANPGQPPSKP